MSVSPVDAAARLKRWEAEAATWRGDDYLWLNRFRDAVSLLAVREAELERLRDVAAAAWGYRVFYEGYWGEDVPGSALPHEQKARLLETLVGWQRELDSAIGALDDNQGDFEAAKHAHRDTIARAIAAVPDGPVSE